MGFAFVFVKTSAVFAAEHLAIAQPTQDGGNVIASPVCLLKSIANINRDVDADFVDQPQRPHWHTPLHKWIVDLVRVQAAFEKLCSIEQIRKQNAIDEKTRAVADNHREFSDLSDKGDRPLARVLRRLSCNDNLH